MSEIFQAFEVWLLREHGDRAQVREALDEYKSLLKWKADSDRTVESIRADRGRSRRPLIEYYWDPDSRDEAIYVDSEEVISGCMYEDNLIDAFHVLTLVAKRLGVGAEFRTLPLRWTENGWKPLEQERDDA